MNERDSLLQQAHEAYLQHNFTGASALYETLLQMYPEDPQILLDYGKATYGEFEDLDKALYLFKRAFESDPTCIEALLWMADTAAMGYGPDMAGAAELYRRAIELDPTCVDAYIGLAFQYRAPGVTLSLEEAIQLYRQALALDPHRFGAYNNLGMRLLDKGDMAGAREAFCRAIELMRGTDREKQIPALQQYIDNIDNKQEIKTRWETNDSPRSRWLSR